jgi:hypothetical protein
MQGIVIGQIVDEQGATQQQVGVFDAPNRSSEDRARHDGDPTHAQNAKGPRTDGEWYGVHSFDD